MSNSITAEQVLGHLQNRLDYERSLPALQELSDELTEYQWAGPMLTEPLPSLSLIRAQYMALSNDNAGDAAAQVRTLSGIAGLPKALPVMDFAYDLSVPSPSCPSAEENFASMARRAFGEDERKHSVVRVFHSDVGDPIFIQKSKGSPSALSLVPVRVAGIDLPAGTIVDIVSSKKVLKSARQEVARDTTFQSVRLGSVAIAPLRVSP